MRRFSTFPTLSLAALLLSACIEQYNAELPESDTQMLYIEGNIMGNAACTFYLSHTLSLSESMADMPSHWVNDASLQVCGSDGARYKAQPQGQGSYLVEVGQLSADATYWLEVTADGEQYQSTPLTPLDTIGIRDLSWTQPREDRMVDIMITPDIVNQADKEIYLRWSHQLFWEIRTPLQTVWEYNPDSLKIFPAEVNKHRGFCQQDSHDIIIGSNADFAEGKNPNIRLYSEDPQSDHFNYLYCTRVLQTVITAEEYEYYKLSKRLSEEMGGLFTPQPSELPGNITCTSDASRHAIGFIGVSMGSVTRQLYIYGSKVGYQLSRKVEIFEREGQLGKTHLEIYNRGYRIYQYFPEMNNQISWTHRWCVDCTDPAVWSASLDFPDFWPKPQI